VLAPTDPIAIKSVLSRIDLPPNLHAVQAGESLFNDGAAVVVFNIALGVAVGSEPAPAPGHLVLVFLREVIGGALLGAASGWLAYQAMRRIDDYPLEIMISLALAAGAYSLAQAAGASGPIAVVVAGLIIGNRATRYAMSETTRRNLELFWSVIDELLNAMLFVLLGSEILSLSFGGPQVAATLIAIPLSLAVRAVTIVVTVLWLHLGNPRKWAGATVLTWSGLRGGISVALALSLPVTPWRQEFLFICYGVVVFTILVQGLTVERVIKLVYPNGGSRLA
jgi:CPA1 family monovalent cation:H+ antiporter